MTEPPPSAGTHPAADRAPGPEATGPRVSPGTPIARNPRPPSGRAEVLAALASVAAIAALGLLVGVLWSWLAPHPHYRVISASGTLIPAYFYSKSFIADDGYFLVITGAAGLLTGAVGYLLGRRYGPGLALGLAAGGLAGALVAWQLGMAISGGVRDRAPGGPLHATVSGAIALGAKGALFAWPVAALLVFLLATAYTRSERVVPSDAPDPEAGG